MTVYVDADACPVVDITLRLCGRFGVPCVLLCDTAHQMQREGATTITVEKGADSADFRLVNLVHPGDIAVTQDYGLAAMCLAKRAVPVNQNGLVYDEHNIEQLLFTRYLSKKIRMAGGRTKGPQKRKPEQDHAFEAQLTVLLSAAAGGKAGTAGEFK